ncbi:hypothetical protein EJ04DRAFT_511377 [Polyplosphaeria fusca]|uniref:Uncharacterized protein n=1 Tax=Polyplosphaeria fusca TaxID=682080 RepID=A0A9P4R3T0_9PLEO|nr:hypothetical protein EJ04DRAFT_511377 [Polyplosphaeria fusca]
MFFLPSFSSSSSLSLLSICFCLSLSFYFRFPWPTHFRHEPKPASPRRVLSVLIFDVRDAEKAGQVVVVVEI